MPKKKLTKKTKPKKKLSPTAEKNKNNQDSTSGIAYTIKDSHFQDFKVRNTANAWWKDREKVNALIQAYKMGCPDSEAVSLAGITEWQRQYFVQEHPDFSEVKMACRNIPKLMTRRMIYNALSSDLDTAKWYAVHKMSDEFNRKEQRELSGSVEQKLDPETEKKIADTQKMFIEAGKKYVQSKNDD